MLCVHFPDTLLVYPSLIITISIAPHVPKGHLDKCLLNLICYFSPYYFGQRIQHFPNRNIKLSISHEVLEPKQLIRKSPRLSKKQETRFRKLPIFLVIKKIKTVILRTFINPPVWVTAISCGSVSLALT